MKRLFILAVTLLFAVACGDKQLSVEEQMAQYQDRIKASLETLNKMELLGAGDLKKWFGELSEADQECVMKTCADIEIVRKEMIEWQKSLSEEDKQKLREFGKLEIADKDYFHMMMQVNKINKLINRRPIPKQVK